jgi:hypothetical protein
VDHTMTEEEFLREARHYLAQYVSK